MKMALLVVALGAAAADAQTLGSFRWQLRPYCNVVTLTVTAVDGNYRLEGTDDQCGGATDKASAMGTAFPNPDGTIGFGLTIVATPGGVPVHVDAALAAGRFDGTWRDSAGGRGDFVLTPGAGNGGSARPLPTPGVPSTIVLPSAGGFVAAGAQGAPIPATGAGTRMMWHAGKGAFRAGTVAGQQWDDANVGSSSAAFGIDTSASGAGAFAAGKLTVASGLFSLAAGEESGATGRNSVALGYRARATASESMAVGWTVAATAPSSLAMGLGARASGNGAIAIGRSNYAAGPYSVVIGGVAETTAAARGSIVLADDSPNAAPVGFQSFTPNQFLARAAGGIGFFTNAGLTAGVSVAPGASTWSQLSDVHSKENFRDLNGDDILGKIAAMSIREWNYKTQDASIRHVGPTAQDFRAAFGLGVDERRIDAIDADGIALAAVKALESRTRAIVDENAALRAELAALRALVTAAGAVRR